MIADVWRAASAIEQRSSRALFIGIDGYVVLTVSLFIAAVLVHNDLRFLQRNAVFPAAQPLFPPLYAATTLLSIYVALQISLSTAREHDLGTLEVLFYGPVNAGAFLLGKFLAALRVYSLALAVLFIWANILVWALGLSFSLAVVWLLLMSVISAAAVVAFGLLTATLGGRSRNSLILFVLVVGLLIALQAAVIVTGVVPTPEAATQNDPLLVLRAALNRATSVLGWVSPIVQLQRAMTALVDNATSVFALHLGVLLVQAIAMLGASIALLSWRGTRR